MLPAGISTGFLIKPPSLQLKPWQSNVILSTFVFWIRADMTRGLFMGEDYLIINRPERPGISSIGGWNKSAIEFELHQLIITSISWIKAPSADFELQQLTLSSIRQFHRHCTDTWDHTIIVSQSGIELHSQIKMAVTYKLVTQLIKGISLHILRFMDNCLTVSSASSKRWYDYLYIFLKGKGT